MDGGRGEGGRRGGGGAGRERRMNGCVWGVRGDVFRY